VHMLGSLPLISRPAINLMLAANPWGRNPERTHDNVNYFNRWRGLEWVYLLTLIGGYCLLLLIVFALCTPASRLAGRTPGATARPQTEKGKNYAAVLAAVPKH